MSEKLAIFAEGLFAAHNGKTAHGVIRYGTRDVVAVIDSTQAGRTAIRGRPVLPAPGADRGDAARGDRARGDGAADRGGADRRQARPGLARRSCSRRSRAGLHVEAGLHTQLSEDPELRRAATRAGVALRDLRAAPAGPDRAGGAVQPPRLGARWSTASARTR